MVGVLIVLEVTVAAFAHKTAQCVSANLLTTTIMKLTFVDIHTCLAIVLQPVSRWTLTVVTSSVVYTGMAASAIVLVAFIYILAFLFLTVLKFKSIKAFANETACGINAFMIAASIFVVHSFTSAQFFPSSCST